jgi:hypothetical protein
MLLTFYSSFLLSLPIIYYFFFNNKKTIFTIFTLFLFINLILSILFWKNPIQYSKNHKVDAIFAKITIISVIYYNIFISELSLFYLILFVLVITVMSLFFYWSNKFSSIEWCCNKHICMHSIAHIFAIIAFLFLFIPDIILNQNTVL